MCTAPLSPPQKTKPITDSGLFCFFHSFLDFFLDFAPNLLSTFTNNNTQNQKKKIKKKIINSITNQPLTCTRRERFDMIQIKAAGEEDRVSANVYAFSLYVSVFCRSSLVRLLS